MVKIYYDRDADLDLLKGKTVAVLGYGSQGHAQAQNLKDSGVNVVVGLHEGSKSRQQAEADGLKVMGAAEAAARADLVVFLVGDMVQSAVYQQIRPHVTEGKGLVFSHGFNILYGQIVPPENVDVFMVAPKSPGHLLRRMYVEGKGVPALIAVHQDYTGRAQELTLAYARAIGCTRAGALQTTFKEETESDLFGEQVILCGGITALIKASYDTLVEAGYQPHVAYFECLNELKLIVDLIFEGGLALMRYSVSDTAEYGDLTRGPRVINEQVRGAMKEILHEVQSGAFAREWILENQAGLPVFNSLRRREKEHPVEQIGAELRSMMPWIKS